MSSSTLLLLRNLALRSSIRKYSSSIRNSPYLMNCVTTKHLGGKVMFPEEGTMTELVMFDPAKEETFTVGDKPLPNLLVGSRLVGSSHGWGVFLGYPGIMVISDFCNPWSSKTNPKFVNLNPRTLFRVEDTAFQNELVSGVAMSSCPDHPDQDFVASVKYMGRTVSIETPWREEDKKVNLIVMAPHVFEHSNIMYSKRDRKLYMVSSDGHHLFSCVGPPSAKSLFPKLRFRDIPRFSSSELQLLDSCHTTHHLVESEGGGGQRFLVKWYAECLPSFDLDGTKRFMVFRQEEEEEEEDGNIYCYTEDIGDLSIFIGGSNEPFCVKASLFPGIKPNSIYFYGHYCGGVYDIATRTPRCFAPKLPSVVDIAPGHRHWVPHWIPPLPL